MPTWGEQNYVPPVTNPNAPTLPRQTGEPTHIDPPGTYRSPIPGYRRDPDPLNRPINPEGPNNWKTDSATPTPANLRMYQLWRQSGHNTLDQDMYDYFGGDDILKEVQKFDPNAKWEEDNQGRRLTYDISKLPAARGFENNREYQRAVYDSGAEYYRPDLMTDDPTYGRVTDARNYKPPTDFLEKWGPVIGPLLVGGFAGLAGGAMPAAARLGMGAVNSLGQSGGRFNPMSLLSAGAGMIPGVGSAMRVVGPAMTAYNLYNSYRRSNNG